MADNISITPGSGATVRTDEVGATQIQVVKIALGADGAEDNLVDSGQQASAASVPVVIASDQSAVPVSGPLTDTQLRATAVPVSVASVPSHAVTNAGTFAVQESGAALTALQLIDNMISGSEAQVDVVAALPAGDNNIGNVDVVTLPATPAGTNLIGKVGIDQVTANANEVVVKSGTITAVTSITNALPAGTNAIGKLAANSGVDIGDVDVTSLPALAAGTNLIGKVQPFSAMLEGGLTELVGINEQVDQNDYSGSVGVSLGGSYSGEILGVAFYATEDGTGAVQDSAGILYVFDADPSISSGDTAMSAAARVTLIGKIAIGAADWDVDANGGLAYVANTPIAFHAVSTLYFAWKHLDATALNDAAGDDEQLEFNFWWKRES